MPYEGSNSSYNSCYVRDRKTVKTILKKTKTYNSRYSLVVTHPTTNLPIWSLCMAERTGCPILSSLWSYVTVMLLRSSCPWIIDLVGQGTRDQKKTKTYNSRYSLVVTHPTTNLPIWSLCMAERTGCPILFSLWSYVTILHLRIFMSLFHRARSKRLREQKDKKQKQSIQQQVFAGVTHPTTNLPI